jgi:hypothetical protein
MKFIKKIIESMADAQMRKAIAHIQEMKRNGTIGSWE